MLLRSLHIVGRQLFYLTSILLIVGFLSLLFLLWLSSEVAERKDELAAWASQQTGYSVSLESAGIYLLELIPKFELVGVRVQNMKTQELVLDAEQVILSLDLLATLHTQEPVLSDAKILHARMAIETDSLGQTSVVGVLSSASTEEINHNAILNKLDWLHKLELSDIKLDYFDSTARAHTGQYIIQHAELSLVDEMGRASASVIPPEQLGETIQFEGNFQLTSKTGLETWQLEINVPSINLAKLTKGYEFQGVEITEGRGTFNADIHLQDNTYKVLLNTAVDSVLFTAKTRTQEPVKMKQINGLFSGEYKKDEWKLSGQNLQVQFTNEAWPLTHFNFSKNDKGEVKLSGDYLNLSDITSIALLADTAHAAIETMKPAGDINHFDFQFNEAGLTKVNLRATEIAFLPWDDIPGASKLSFKLEWGDKQGQVNFDSHQTSLYVAQLDAPVYLDSMIGELKWARQDENWRLFANGFRVWNDDIGIQADGFVSHQDADFDSDIELNLYDTEVNRWKVYVPQSILPADFKSWSDEAFVAGRIVSGRIALKGDPTAFPFDTEPEKGEFDMQLTVENTQLHYAPGWPDIVNVNGQISGQGNNLLITSQSGKIAGFDFDNVTTKISNLVRAKPVLTVDGVLSGTSDQALAFLQNSPLQSRFGKIAEWVGASGHSQLGLKLKVPLTQTSETDVDGFVTFENTQLTTKAVSNLKVDDVNGRLNFNNNGVSAQNMTGSAFGEKIGINVLQDIGKTLVNIDGTVDISSLMALWPEVIPDFVSGTTTYLTQLSIQEPQSGQFAVDIAVNSELEGIVIDTPQPLTKIAQEKALFKLSFHEHNGDNLRYQLQYDDWLNTTFVEGENKVLTGQVVLGGGRAQLPILSGFEIMGHIDSLDIDEWQEWNSSRVTNDSPVSNQIRSVDASANKITFMGQEVEQVEVQAEHQHDKWNLYISSQQVKGQITLSDDFAGISGNFDYLNIQRPPQSESQSNDEPILWPAIQLKIDSLSIDDLLIGEFEIDAGRTKSEWRINNASIKSELFDIKATGSWISEGTREKSHLVTQVESDDLKALLGHFGYQQVIDARQTEVNAELMWAGTPMDVNLQKLGGHIGLKVGRGQLLDLEPGAAGRIFGLFSIAALPRRLSLDFSDLFGKGLDFSSITGEIDFKNGVANTDNLILTGDSALVEISGPANLVEKTYNQTVKITPNVSSTLPLAGAVAGGPVGLGVGAAILLFDKIAGTVFDREIVNLISYRYSLTGPWDDPQLNILNAATK